MSEVNQNVNAMHMYKASSSAGWSYIGLLIPLLGIIFAGNSFSHLKHFEPTDEQERREWDRINTKASVGMVLSVLLFVTGLFFAYVLFSALASFPENFQKELDKSYSSQSLE